MKSKIPLVILELIQPLVDENFNLIESVKNSEVLFDIKDKTEESDFYYKIVRQENSNGHLGYVLEYKPKNKFEPIKIVVWSKLEQIVSSLKEWISLLESYNKINTVYDDPILKSNQNRFEQQFEILDPDAKFASFDLGQQLFLDEYLNTVKGKISELASKADDIKKEELTELHSEAIEIQTKLTTESKKTIVKRLSKFWAKSQKIGLEVIKEVFVDLVAEITKKLITGA